MTEPHAGARLAASRRDALNRALYRIGWRFGRYVPPGVIRAAARSGGRLAARRPGRHIRQWQTNIAIATGVAPGRDLTAAGMASFLRTYGEVLSLPGWTHERLVAAVTTDAAGEERMRTAMESGQGVVLALPHQGNWDLAGAWACSTGIPVSTVAEQLGEPEFEAFLRFRVSLGMTVYSHRQRGVVSDLVRDVGAGKMVCLIADRDLDRTGVPVSWPSPRGPVPVSLPAGPALVARQSGALFMAAACHYTDHGMHIGFSEPIAHRPGRDGLTAMVADVADYFAAAVVAHPEDWHLLQPFFPR